MTRGISTTPNYTLPDFDFEVDDSFVMVSFRIQGNNNYYGLSSDGYSITSSQVLVHPGRRKLVLCDRVRTVSCVKGCNAVCKSC